MKRSAVRSVDKGRAANGDEQLTAVSALLHVSLQGNTPVGRFEKNIRTADTLIGKNE